MNEFSLITIQSDHDYSSFNQSAINTTGITIPLYTHDTKSSHYIKKKSRQKDQNFVRLLSNKTEVFINKDNIKHLPVFYDEKTVDKRTSINSIDFQYYKKPIKLCNMKQFSNFVHITKKSKKKQRLLLRRFFFTFICLFVITIGIVLTILLIVHFS